MSKLLHISLIIALFATQELAQSQPSTRASSRVAANAPWRNLPRATATPREVFTPDNSSQQDATTQTRQQPTLGVLLPGNYWDALRQPLKVGQIAPDFSLPVARDTRWTLAKKAVAKTDKSNFEYSKPTPNERRRELSLSQIVNSHKGVTVVVFWAFWCDTWKDVGGVFARMKPRLQAARALPICVAVDASQQPVARRAFANGRIWYPVVIDTKSEIVAQWSVRRVPTVFVLDETRRIRQVWEGFPGETALMRAVYDARKPFVDTKVNAQSKAKPSDATANVTSSTR